MTDSERPEDELDFDGDDEFILDDADFDQALEQPAEDAGEDLVQGISAASTPDGDGQARGGEDEEDIIDFADDPDWDDGAVGGRDDTLLEEQEPGGDEEGLLASEQASLFVPHGAATHGFGAEGGEFDEESEGPWDGDALSEEDLHAPHGQGGDVESSGEGDWLDRDGIRDADSDEVVLDDEMFDLDSEESDPEASDGGAELNPLVDSEDSFLVLEGVEGELTADTDSPSDEASDSDAEAELFELEADRAADADRIEDELFGDAEEDGDTWDAEPLLDPSVASAEGDVSGVESQDAEDDWSMAEEDGAPVLFSSEPEPGPSGDALDEFELEADDEVASFDETPATLDSQESGGSAAPTLEEIQAAMQQTGEGWENLELGGGANDEGSPDLTAGEYTLDDRSDDVEPGGYDEVDDGIYSEAAVVEAEAEADKDAWEDPDYSEHEESYLEDGEAKGTLITQPFQRRVVRRLVASLAALLLVGASIGVVVTKPEWLGLSSEPDTVDVVRYQRPSVGSGLQEPPGETAKETGLATTAEGDGVPEVPAPDATGLDPTNPPGDSGSIESEPSVAGSGEAQPVVPEIAVPEPPSIPEPQVPDVPPSLVTPDVASTEPPAQPGIPQPTIVPVTVPEPTAPLVMRDGDGFPVVVPSGAGGNEQDRSDRARPIPVGDNLIVADPSEPPPGHDGIRSLGLVTGGRAFAQLRNGNFFVGSIKRVLPASVTLSFADGEVTLPRAELKVLAPVTAQEFQSIQQAESGYVRLQNDNRIQGNIVNTILEEYIVVKQRASHVILPLADVKQQEEGSDTGVQFGEDADGDAWLRSVVAEQLKARQRTTRSSKTAPVQPAPNGK